MTKIRRHNGPEVVRAAQEGGPLALRQLFLMLLGTVDYWTKYVPKQEHKGKGPKMTLLEEIDLIDSEGDDYSLSNGKRGYIDLLVGSAMMLGKKKVRTEK